MPIQCYECPEHEGFEVLQRTFDVPLTRDCPQCGKTSTYVFASPALVEVKRDWNEQANLYQRDPYTQAKAQLTNTNRRAAEYGGPQPKITEEAIQVGAKAIHEQATNPQPSMEQRRISHIRKQQQKTSPIC
jgi:putative FmdB family regulatory protein